MVKIKNKDKGTKVLEYLIYSGIVPQTGIFLVTEGMLEAFVNEYPTLDNKDKGKKVNYRFARKLAGLSFVKENLSRGASSSDISCGLVYIIANPVFEKHVKIGMTLDIKKRLSQFQTYDPFQRFYVKHYDFVLDRKAAEKKMLCASGVSIENGEWICNTDSLNLIRQAGDKEQIPGG